MTNVKQYQPEKRFFFFTATAIICHASGL